MELILLLLSSLHIKFDYMYFQYSIASAFCCVPIAYYLSRRMGLLFGCLALYTGVYFSYTSLNRHNKYGMYPETWNAISINGMVAFLFCLLFLFGVLFLSEKRRFSFRWAIGAYGVLNSIYVIQSAMTGFRLIGGNGFTGFLDYAGMNASLIALCTSFLVPKPTQPMWRKIYCCLGLWLSFVAIILSKSAVPFFVLGVILSTHLVLRSRMVFVGLLPLFLSISAGFLAVGTKVISSSSRFEAYRVFFKYLYVRGAILFGMGLGSLRILAPDAQLRENFMMKIENGRAVGYAWEWLHSDFLQVGWELGVFAFLLCIGIYFQALWKSFQRRDAPLLSLGMGMGLCAFVNYPCRYAATSFLLTYFVVCSLDSPTKAS